MKPYVDVERMYWEKEGNYLKKAMIVFNKILIEGGLIWGVAEFFG